MCEGMCEGMDDGLTQKERGLRLGLVLRVLPGLMWVPHRG